MTKSPFTFANAIAVPSTLAWSTVYSAGNIAAVISLSVENPGQNIPSLGSIGKELLQTLESEYFTLETKTLTAIKEAISTTCQKKPEGVTLSLAASVLIENVLYVFIYGKGLVFMKRGEKIGDLLSQKEYGALTAASGFLQHEDYIVLEAGSFPEIIKKEVIKPFLTKEELSNLSEGLFPLLSDAQKGDAAAIAFFYKDDSTASKNTDANANLNDKTNLTKPTGIKQEEILEKKSAHNQEVNITPSHLSRDNFKETKKSFLPESKSLPHKKKLFLTIAFVVGLIIIASVFFFTKKQQDMVTKNIYQTYVIPAQQKFEEGQNLLKLNKIAAEEDFSSAKQMVSDAIMRLPIKSQEAANARSLQDKINSAITTASQIPSISAKQVDINSSSILAAIAKHSDAVEKAQDDKSIYILTANGVISSTKSNGKETTIIKNQGDWKNGVSIGTYLGNLYVLDSADGIVKYVPTGSDYGKSAYFSGQKPDLSNSVSLAIDQSIWILFSDGGIKKFTRGTQDDLTITGLDNKLKNPTEIVTTIDMNNIYVLDSGNNRVVIFDKKGAYVSQYAYSGLSNIKYMDVLENDKKIYILSGSNAYEIDMK